MMVVINILQPRHTIIIVYCIFDRLFCFHYRFSIRVHLKNTITWKKLQHKTKIIYFISSTNIMLAFYCLRYTTYTCLWYWRFMYVYLTYLCITTICTIVYWSTLCNIYIYNITVSIWRSRFCLFYFIFVFIIYETWLIYILCVAVVKKIL